MTDAFWTAVPPSLIALGVLGKQFWDAKVAKDEREAAKEKADATIAKVEEVHSVVNSKHDEALRQIEELKAEVRRLNAAKDNPSERRQGETPGPAAVTLNAGIVSVPKRP